MKRYHCTQCNQDKLVKDFPVKYQVDDDRPWRYCTSCVQTYYKGKSAKFTKEEVDTAVNIAETN